VPTLGPNVADATVALVTGASRGIGRAAGLALARNGVHVAFGYRSDAEGAEEAAAKAAADGGEATAIAIDVQDEQSIADAYRRIEQDLGPVRVLVNNAGFTKDGLAVKYSTETWDTTMEVNLRGAFFCSRRALPAMLKARWGRIVNVASVAAMRGNAGQTAYTASKAGLVAFTKSLAREVGGRGITVNAVCPGFVETKMTAVQGDENRQRYLDMTPAGRFGTAEDIAAVIAFLAGGEASYVNGAVIAVDGGLSA
jgi:3-oxoacyl-[acyl-carrier protein] reductase